MCTCKIVVLVFKPIAFFMSSLLPPLLDLKVPFMSLREAGEIEKKNAGVEGKEKEKSPPQAYYLLILLFLMDTQWKPLWRREVKLNSSHAHRTLLCYLHQGSFKAQQKSLSAV